MAASSGLVWKDWRTSRDQLKEWREESYRRSEEVVALGRRLLKDYSSALGDEGDRTSKHGTCIRGLVTTSIIQSLYERPL